MSLMHSNNYKNVKGVKGMLRVQTHTLNTVKAFHIKPSQTNVKPVKGLTRVRAREGKNQQSIIKNIKCIKNISTREIYTLNMLNTLTKPTAISLSDVKGTICTLNTLNISANMV